MSNLAIPRPSAGHPAPTRPLLRAFLALAVLSLAPWASPPRAVAEDRPGDAILKEVLAQVEGAQKATKAKSVLVDLSQAHDATVLALKGADHSKESVDAMKASRRLLQHALDGAGKEGGEAAGHISKAIAMVDAYLLPGVDVKPDPSRTLPGPKPALPSLPGGKDRARPEVPTTDPYRPPVAIAAGRGRFRVWLNGFLVTTRTADGVLDAVDPNGVGDEVALITHAVTVDAGGVVRSSMWGRTRTGTMGARPPNDAQAGSRTPTGGLRSGDAYPTPTPWHREGDSRTALPPTRLFEGELGGDGPAAVIMPTLWEWDATDPTGLETSYMAALDRDRAAIGSAVAAQLRRPAGPTPAPFVVDGSALGIGNTVLLDMGAPSNRPIGMRPLSGRFGFRPQALVLTYDAALRIMATDFGHGRGIIPIRYQDDTQWMQGDYTLFLEVERVAGEAAAAGPERPWASMTRFNPLVHGFLFVNSFTNDGSGGATTGGLCGGMMYAAMDYFLAGRRIPAVDYLPAVGSPLQSYIFGRQNIQLTSNLGQLVDMAAGAVLPVNETPYFERGLGGDTLRGIRGQIDAGTPAILLLQNPDDIYGHSVLVLGYDMGRYRGDLGEHREDLRFFVYDPNHPREIRILKPDFATQRYVYEPLPRQAEDPHAHWLTFVLDTQYRPVEAPSISDPDRGGPDGLVRELHLILRTGGDELVASNDDVSATVHIEGRPPQVFENLNNHMRWLPFYDQTIPLLLSTPAQAADIRRVVVTKTARLTALGVADLWDLDKLEIQVLDGGPVVPRQIFLGEGTPLLRFTEHETTFTAEIHR